MQRVAFDVEAQHIANVGALMTILDMKRLCSQYAAHVVWYRLRRRDVRERRYWARLTAGE